MRFRDYLTEAINYIKHHKLKIILIIMFLTLLFLVSNILIQVASNTKSIFDDYTINYSEGRTLVAYKKQNYEDTINELTNQKHILVAYNQNFNVGLGQITSLKENNLTIYIYPLNNKYSPKIIKGNKVLKSNEIICPKYITTSDKEIIKSSDLVDMKPYLNKEINFYYVQKKFKDLHVTEIVREYNKNFKLVGLYDNGYSENMYNTCYMLESDVRKITLEEEFLYSEEYLSQVHVEENTAASFAVVDKLENIPEVIKTLEDKGYEVDRQLNMNTDLMNSIIKISNSLFIIMLVVILGVCQLYLKNLIKSQKNTIGLYKCFGYKDKEISKIIMMEILIIFLISIILEFIILCIGLSFANYEINKILYYAYIDLKIYFVPQLLFIIFMSIFILIISIKVVKRICKLEVRSILSENNL